MHRCLTLLLGVLWLSSALALTPSDESRLREVGLTWSLARWALDDLARAALLLRAGEVLAPSALEAVVDRAYRNGDTRQRQAILRALPLLPQPDRFLGIAVDAERSGIPPLFEAIACENPYPAAHFPVSTATAWCAALSKRRCSGRCFMRHSAGSNGPSIRTISSRAPPQFSNQGRLARPARLY